MRQDRLLLLPLIALAVASRDASGVGNPSEAFGGDWRFSPGAGLTATCSTRGMPIPFGDDLGDKSLAIKAVDPTTVELDLGCHCPLTLVLGPSGTTAGLATAPQSCDLVLLGYSVHATIDRADLSLDDSGGLSFHLASSSADVMRPVDPLTCVGGGIEATLTRIAAKPTDCGPDTRAVGVLEYAAEGTIDCRVYAGAEGLEISMEDETSNVCPYQSGDAGEGPWVLPHASRAPMRCVAADPKRAPDYNILPFCRVDGARFKPMTADPNDTASFYAVLNLGADENGNPAPCPNRSTPITASIDNEDGDDGALANNNTFGGRIGPNVVLGAGSQGRTTLHFCYFRSAMSEADTMAAFPDLGFPYAVFHAFEGPQPPWVILKRWAYSDNQSANDNRDSQPSSEDASALESFHAVIETPTNGDMFNMARVR